MSFAWERDDEIVLITTEGDGYNEALEQLGEATRERFDKSVFLSANRPHGSVRSIVGDGFHYVDCISGLTGFMPSNEPDVLFIESPTLLEKAAMRAEQLLRRMPPPSALIVDSLSTLAMYNDPGTVTELAHNLISRLRLQQRAAALLIVQGKEKHGLVDALSTYADRVVTPSS